MRKTAILAIATAVLAVVTVIADLIRVDAGSVRSKVSAAPVVQVQTADGLNVRSFDAI
jgi:adenine-specific DNA methylase